VVLEKAALFKHSSRTVLAFKRRAAEADGSPAASVTSGGIHVNHPRADRPGRTRCPDTGFSARPRGILQPRPSLGVRRSRGLVTRRLPPTSGPLRLDILSRTLVIRGFPDPDPCLSGPGSLNPGPPAFWPEPSKLAVLAP
jgi:hypothetical protein